MIMKVSDFMKIINPKIKNNCFDNEEWLLTNGIGGYAYSPVATHHTKAYNGLLIASLTPPTMRYNVLNQLDERVVIDGNSYSLESYQYDDHIEDHTAYIKEVIVEEFVTYRYEIGNVHIDKTITLVHGENTVAINYHITSHNHQVNLFFTPYFSLRDHAARNNKATIPCFSVHERHLNLLPLDHKDVLVRTYMNTGVFNKETKIKDNLYYEFDCVTGYKELDALYSPGYYNVMMSDQETKDISFVCTLDQASRTAREYLFDEVKRKAMLVNTKDPIKARLEKIADQFIVNRSSTKNKTIIAGYPWFSDWGRDTLIALEGLTLVTKRFDDAKSIIRTFAKTIHHGLVVTLFEDGTNKPRYNTADASLWLINACYMYEQYSHDTDFITKEIYPHLKEIISAYIRGTDHAIYMDDDFLIHAGDNEDQITWMDVYTHGKAITPRHGKPVELNALWYNALMIMAYFSHKTDHDESYGLIAQRTKKSFADKFWCEQTQCLYDVIEPNDASIRPNQLYALSLPFPVLSFDLGKKMLKVVDEKLYAKTGIRSLSYDDPRYIAHYEGNLDKRDLAYHMGTSWAYLMGPYIRCHVLLDEDKSQARALLQPLLETLDHNCINGINEIFDGDAPHTPRGTVNQAWSVGELLVAYEISRK